MNVAPARFQAYVVADTGLTVEDIRLPDSIPVITLAQCNLLPHGMLPLFIFEPRYREMLQHALDHERMFCVSTRLPDAAEDDDDAVFPYSTAGLVRACVRGDDGSSHLVLQGMRRVRFLEWLQKEPFRIAGIEPIATTNGTPEKAQALQAQLLETLSKIEGNVEKLVEQLEELESPDIFADVCAFNLIRDPYARQQLIEIEDVSERLEFMLKTFAGV